MASPTTRIQHDNKNIKVFIRIRPYSQNEPQDHSCVNTMDQKQISINTKQAGQVPSFVFDRIYEQNSTQQQIYKQISQNIIDNAFIGINGTIFCYGQTSSGKTYTCIGKDLKLKDQQKYGILPRMIDQILQRIQQAPKHIEYKMKISMIEIYNEKIKDLLDHSKSDLKIRSDKSRGIFIQNMTQKYLLSKQQANLYIIKGIENRSVGMTQMNALSSRSHMLFIITIHQQDLYTGQATIAKITLVDLAGSQKISRTGVQGKLLQQAKKINTSLSALGKVINILSQENKNKKIHIPYRDSKLTRLLQQSLGGNCLTKLIINISPSITNQHETLSSLRFGFRAKSIKNQPKINKQYTVPELLQLLHKSQRKIKVLTDVIKEIMKQKNQEFVSMKEFIKQYLHIQQNNNNTHNNNINGYLSDQSQQRPFSLIKSLSPSKMTIKNKNINNMNKSINNSKSNIKTKQADTKNRKQKYNPQISQILKLCGPQLQQEQSIIKSRKQKNGQLSLVNLFKSIDFQLGKKQPQISSAREIKKHNRGKSEYNISKNSNKNSNIENIIKIKIKINDDQSDKQSLLIDKQQQDQKQSHNLQKNKNKNSKVKVKEETKIIKTAREMAIQDRHRDSMDVNMDVNKQQYLLQDFNDQEQDGNQISSSIQHEQHENEVDRHNELSSIHINSPYCRSLIGSSCTFNSKILDISISAIPPSKAHQLTYHHNINQTNYNKTMNNHTYIDNSIMNNNMNRNQQSIIPQSSFFDAHTIQFNIAEIKNNLRILKCLQKKKHKHIDNSIYGPANDNDNERVPAQ